MPTNHEKPFIHLFRSPLGYYIYDVNCNIILKTEKSVYAFLKLQQKNDENLHTFPDAEQIAEKIKQLKNRGFLSSNRVENIIHPEDINLEDHIRSGVNGITLQITQQCNLRCDYCIYSGGYVQRPHTNKKMSLELAKKGLDFLKQHSMDSVRLAVGFYGGEPLLEFPFIKTCVEYFNRIIEGKEVHYHLTTNGTLLNEAMITFLQEHDFRLLLSLDGPREVHDKNRKFAANGCGTYDTIINNLTEIEKKYPDFLNNNVTFSSVIDPDADYNCLNDFFMNFQLVKETRVLSTNISDRYTKNKQNYSREYRIKSNYEKFKAYLVLLGRLDQKHIPNFVYENVLSEYHLLNKKIAFRTRLIKNHHPSGPCIPTRKLFMDVNGFFFPCERVSESSDAMKLGHIETGLDLVKIRALLNIGKLTENECKECWALELCDHCAVAADNIDELSAELKKSRCAQTKKRAENSLMNFLTISELKNNYANNAPKK